VADGPADWRTGNEPPIIKFVNLVLYQRCRIAPATSTSKPFETNSRSVTVLDGALYEIDAAAQASGPAGDLAIKVMANLDIAERRLPQDGPLSITLAEDKSICASRPCPRSLASRWFCASWTARR